MGKKYNKLAPAIWIEIEKRFVENGESYRSLEKVYKQRNGTITRRGQRHNWQYRRDCYLTSVKKVIGDDTPYDKFNDCIVTALQIISNKLPLLKISTKEFCNIVGALKNLALTDQIVNGKTGISGEELPPELAEVIKKLEKVS